MKNQSANRFSVKILLLGLCLACSLTVSGCSKQVSEEVNSTQSLEKSAIVTCFGTIEWRESVTLHLPFDLPIQRIEVRSGQVAGMQDALFYVDYSQLLLQKASLNHLLEYQITMKNSNESELTGLKKELAAVKAETKPDEVRMAEVQSQIYAKTAQISRIENDIFIIQTDVEKLIHFLSGQNSGNIILSETGMVTIAKEGYLIDNIVARPYETVRANEPILDIANIDSLEGVCYVEEQLVKDIRVGNEVRLALYSDSTKVVIGSVTYVSQRAIQRNGETMVEIVIGYEGDSFLPGYNVVAKINPMKTK